MKKLLLPGLVWHTFYVIFAISLFFDGITSLWIMMITGIIAMAWVFVYEVMSVEFCFSVEITGTEFAFANKTIKK